MVLFPIVLSLFMFIDICKVSHYVYFKYFNFQIMKTNVFWLCQYCDKKMSSKGTVKGHISKQHKADPDNPLMFRRVMASPKEVTSTLLIDQTSDKDAPTKVVSKGDIVTKDSVVKTKGK